MIILDTNVVSELMRSAGAPEVLHWVRSQPVSALATTAITVAEIEFGIRRMPDGKRRDQLRAGADEIFDRFTEQVLPFDDAAARRYGLVVTERERAGHPIDGFDAQIASICLERSAGLATRNVRDFGHLGIELIDPWTA